MFPFCLRLNWRFWQASIHARMYARIHWVSAMALHRLLGLLLIACLVSPTPLDWLRRAVAERRYGMPTDKDVRILSLGEFRRWARGL